MTLFSVATPATAMRFMWLGALGLAVTFLCLLAGRGYGSFPGPLLAGAIAGFALDIYSAVAIWRGQFKRNRELPARLDHREEWQRKTAAILQRTTGIGVTLVFLGVMLNFMRSLFGAQWPDPFWGLILLFAGLCTQMLGQARYLGSLD